MTKRVNGINKSSPSKRKKSTDNIASKLESLAQDRSCAGWSKLITKTDPSLTLPILPFVKVYEAHPASANMPSI